MPLDLPMENDNKLTIKRFRPEFLKTYQYPLSATSFFVNPLGTFLSNIWSSFNWPRLLAPNYESIHEENEVEALYASKFLREDAIRSFIKKLDNLDIVPIDSAGFTRELHRNGINIRLLGK